MYPMSYRNKTVLKAWQAGTTRISAPDLIRASRSKLPAARAERLDSTLRLVRPSLNPC